MANRQQTRLADARDSGRAATVEADDRALLRFGALAALQVRLERVEAALERVVAHAAHGDQLERDRTQLLLDARLGVVLILPC